jgi:putative Ca2+/H+ antiporter (TMEM165/GDT1 family)
MEQQSTSSIAGKGGQRTPEHRRWIPITTLAILLMVALLLGQLVHSFIPIAVAVAVECILFVLIAVWRFNREEF